MGISIENHLQIFRIANKTMFVYQQEQRIFQHQLAHVFLHGLSGPHDSQQFSPPKSSGYTMPPCCARSNPILRVMIFTIIIQINLPKKKRHASGIAYGCMHNDHILYIYVSIYTYIHTQLQSLCSLALAFPRFVCWPRFAMRMWWPIRRRVKRRVSGCNTLTGRVFRLFPPKRFMF